ncbi:MAG TPA: hypothetical protein DHW02_10875, partial [Ktedonobacter sp.]|nr:hypothetical protein [Ktedonobacter sp.]
HSQGIVEIVLANDQNAREIVSRLNIAEHVIEAQGNMLRLSEAAQSSILSTLVNANIGVESLNPVSRTLEEVYVQTTQKNDAERQVMQRQV